MTDRIHLKIFYPNYFSFLINGAMVLIVGAVLPYIIEEAQISYSIAGAFLSVFAIGNFLASFVNPSLSKAIGRKKSIVLTAIFQPTCLLGISFVPSVPVLFVLFLFLGISRGCYSIINNAYLNEKGDGSAAAMNVLHASFATGAFFAPSLLSLYSHFGLSWRAIIYTICACSLCSIWLISRLDLKDNFIKNNSSVSTDSSVISTEVEKTKFYKMPIFWVTGFILFFYLGVENCVNGWFVTYFKNTGIMTQTFANELVSFTWASVLVGRILTAIISTKIKQKWIILIDCIAAAIFLVLLISSKNLVLITISIIGLGLFLAGIYPTGVSNARSSIKGSDFGTSMFLAISALGGIITPQVVGSVADKIGLVGAITTLLVNAFGMIILSIWNTQLQTRSYKLAVTNSQLKTRS